MEKQVYTLQIDPDLRDLIPPLSEEEHHLLEDSIVRDGCDTPLTVWNGIIVDGHNRYEICLRHGIPFTYEEREFADKEAAMFWMLEHQLARRNLNSYQRSELAIKYEPMVRRIAAAHQNTSTGGTTPQLRQNSDKAAVRTTRELGKIAGVSHDTIDKVRKLNERANEETKKKLRAGEVSIHKAYTDMVNKEHEGETRICECCGQEKPFSEFRIRSKSTDYSVICKDCEAKAKRAAKEAVEQAVQPTPARETGIGVKDGKTAHVFIGIPDDPAFFDQVMGLFQHAQNAFLAAFEATVKQYKSSMISEEHTAAIMEMIDYIADTSENMLNEHLSKMKEDK